MTLCQFDRDVVAKWIEHGIPVDRTTVEHAGKMIGQLVESERYWIDLAHLLLDGKELVCSSCGVSETSATFQTNLDFGGHA